MNRAVLVYLLLVLAPSSALAFFAYRAADRDLSERREEARARAREEVEALGRRIEMSLAEAARRMESEGVAGFAAEGKWLGFSAEPAVAAPSVGPGADELGRYAISLRGGESFELGGQDPARAFDAYTFYLPGIRTPVLRARLQLGAARSALAMGNAPLAHALFRRLFDEAEGLTSAEGLPLDLVAACRLLDSGSEETYSLRDAAAARLRAAAPRLSTPVLAGLAERLAPEDLALREASARRRELEVAVVERPEILTSADAALTERGLLLAHAGPASSSLREIRLGEVLYPSLDAGELLARLEFAGARSTEPEEGAVRPIRLARGGPVLATLRVVDPRLEETLEAAARQRVLQRALIGLLVLVTLGGGAALAVYLSRERHLARLRSRLLANVSHELKTPVTSIRMLSELLAEDGADAAQTRRFGRLLGAEASRLSQLVENLLDFSSLAKKEASLPVEPVEITALLARVAEAFEVQAKGKGASFRFELGSTGSDGMLVSTNAPAVERIVLNLLDNALKYRRSPDAPVAEGHSIRLEAGKEKDFLRVSIADNGRGIPRREQERVFEELYRVRYDDYAVKGSGLGLSIARRLARKLGGDISLESQENAGSTFTLMLPGILPGKDGTQDASSNPHR